MRRHEEIKQAGSVDPYFTSFEVGLVHDCNLRCRYCATGFGRWGQKPMVMTAEVMEQAIAFMMAVPGNRVRVVLSGGENLMHSDLFEFFVLKLLNARKAKGKHVRIELATNGIGMTSRVSDFLLEHKVSVILSLDGDAETTDRNRRFANGGGVYATVVTHLKEYQRLHGRRFPEHDGYLRADCTVDARSDCRRAVHHLFDLGFSEVLIRPALASVHTGWDAAVNTEQFLENFARLLDDVLSPLPPIAILTGDWPKMVSNAIAPLKHRVLGIPPGMDCGALRHSLCIRADGALIPCFMFNGADYQNWCVGHVRAGIDSSAVQRVRQMLNATAPNCRGCEQANWCGKGCPLRFWQESRRDRSEIGYSFCRFQRQESTIMHAAYRKLLEKSAFDRP